MSENFEIELGQSDTETNGKIKGIFYGMQCVSEC